MANRRFALLLGTLYAVVALAGFVLTGLASSVAAFLANDGDRLVVFGVNPLHNAVHLAVGGVLIAVSPWSGAARVANTVIGCVFIALAVVGVAVVATLGQNDPSNLLALNQGDNVLHAVTGLLGVYLGLTGTDDDLERVV